MHFTSDMLEDCVIIVRELNLTCANAQGNYTVTAMKGAQEKVKPGFKFADKLYLQGTVSPISSHP